MPHVRQAILDGQLSIDHVDLLIRHVTPARAELFAEHEADLVGLLATLSSFADAQRLVRYWASLADDWLDLPAGEPRPSRLYQSRSAETGELHLEGRLDVVDGEIVENELDRLVRELRERDAARGVERTPAQRRAAALVQMAARSAGADGVARPLFQAVVGDETLRRLCELASGQVLTPDRLAPHIDAAVIESMIFDGPTRPLGVVQRRSFTGALRRAIQIRDRRCQHESVCDTPASRCDIDHITPAAEGGVTSTWNGRVLCAGHNRYAHLRDHPPPPTPPGREPDVLDTLRARLRWQVLNSR
jgi:hypothetical protein